MDPGNLSTLEGAMNACTERCLFVAAQWLAELHASVLPQTHPSTDSKRSSTTEAIVVNDPSDEHDKHEDDLFAVARTYFVSRQYRRAAFALLDLSGSKARFLRAYCKYLMLEPHVTSRRGRHSIPHSTSVSLADLILEIGDPPDAFLLFLKGKIYRDLSARAEATACLIESLNMNPWNWSAWLVLSTCLEDSEEFSSVQKLLPPHPMTHLFGIRVMIDIHSPTDDDIQTIDGLLDMFPRSSYLLAQKALILYHQKDWALAEQIYDHLRKEDPRRIDDMDVYSNILYVMEKNTKLSRLAHDVIVLDKDRPEVCCIVGNHLSLKGEHKRAVRYFERAVQIDKTYLSAWTLMGHEYVEMKNSEAAIEAYRRAVDLDRRDYRAWFGLGQAYELLSMHRYALHYYQRATALRPYDVRVWQAMAMCYADLSKPYEAIECYKRAQIAADPREVGMHLKIAALYDALGAFESAAFHHRQVVDITRTEGKSVAEYAKSALYLARHHLSLVFGQEPGKKDMHQGDKTQMGYAREYLQVIAESNAEEMGVASDLLRKLNRFSFLAGSSAV